MALNVTTAVIGGGCQRAVSSPSLAQWDRGQILKITGVDLPVTYNVEFCCQGDLTTTTMLGGADGVEIPNLLLQRGLPIIAYLVLHEGQDDRETEYWITIYVKQRAMPPSVTPDPEQADIIDQLVAALDEGVTAAENAAAQAEAQVEHYPTVIDGTWHVWDQETESWEDTGEPAEGPQGPEGPEGPEGPQGETGPAGITPIVEVTEISGGHNVAFDYGTGDARNTDFDVMDGEVSAAQLQAVADAKAPVIIDTASGAIASFPDGANAMPIKALTVNIEPQQDLHGQSNPYPAGGGKNKFDLAEIGAYNELVVLTKTETGFTITNNNSYAVNTFVKTGAEYNFPVTDGTYAISISQATIAGIAVYGSTDGSSFSWLANGITGGNTSATFTVSGQIYVRFVMYIAAGATATIDKFQFETGSTPTAWSPYSNICPISGWTGVTVEHTGKNLLPVYRGISSDAHAICLTGNTYLANDINSYIFLKAGTYTISYGDTLRGSLFFNVFGGSETNFGQVTSNTFTVSADGYIRLRIYDGSYTFTESSIDWVQLELNHTVTTYEQYQGETIPVSWQTEAGTVYGGQGEIVSGELTDDMTKLKLLSSFAWQMDGATGSDKRFGFPYASTPSVIKAINQNNTYISNVLAPNNIGLNSHDFGTFYISNSWIVVHDKNSHFETLADFKAWLDSEDVYLVYKVATPVTYQLDPVTVSTLLGENNIFADCGDISVDYPCDTKKYIDKKLAALVAALS